MVYLPKMQMKRRKLSLNYVLFCLILGITYVVPSVNSESCTSPLGMEDGRIKKSQIRVSSIRPGTTASGEQARLRKNIPNWGAWCPDISGAKKLSVDQYIQVELFALTKITAIATQGRECNNAKQRFRKYIVSFSEDGRTWDYYKQNDGSETFNGAKVFDGTAGSASDVVRRSLQTTAKYIRVHPCYLSDTPEYYQCMRLEVYGCALQTVILSYSMPIGQTADGKVHYKDTSYNGIITNDFYRKNGIGILTDGKFGPTDAKELSGEGWVGWSSTLTESQYIAITFEFSEMRKFKDVTLTVNVDKKSGNAVFDRSRIFFASTKDSFSAISFLQYCPRNVPYNDDPYNANVILSLCDNTARFIKVQLYFGGKWLLITEFKFSSVPVSKGEMLKNCSGNTAAHSCALIRPTTQSTVTQGGVVPQANATSKPGCEDCTTPSLKGKQTDTELISTSAAVTIPLAIVFVVVVVILIIYKRRRQSPKLSTPVPAVNTVEMQNPRLRPLPQPLQNNQELGYVIPVDVGSAPDVLGYVIPVDGGTAPDELGYVIPVDGGTAPDELGYVIPADGGTAMREEVQISPPSGYTELNRNSPAESETTNAVGYQKLLNRDSGYVIPAEPEPVYQQNMPGIPLVNNTL